MDGSVGVRSEPGIGSCFWFTATLRPSPAGGPPPPCLPRLPPGLSVLVVASDPAVRAGLESYAAALGAAARGADALAEDGGEEATQAAAAAAVIVVAVDASQDAGGGLEGAVGQVGRLQRRDPLRRAVLLVPVTLLSRAAERASQALDGARTVILPQPVRLAALHRALADAAQAPAGPARGAASQTPLAESGDGREAGPTPANNSRTTGSPDGSRSPPAELPPAPCRLRICALALEQGRGMPRAGAAGPLGAVAGGRQGRNLSHLDLAGSEAGPAPSGVPRAGCSSGRPTAKCTPALKAGSNASTAQSPPEPQSMRKAPVLQGGGQARGVLQPTGSGGSAAPVRILVVDGLSTRPVLACTGCLIIIIMLVY